MGTQSTLILRTSHLGSSLVDNPGHLLSVTFYNAILEKGNDWLAEIGFALERVVKMSLELRLVPIDACH